VVLYTSGTSGRPKAVPLSSANFLASAAGAASLLGEDVQRRWLLCLPMFHVGGLSVALRSVLAGGEVVLHRRFDPARIDSDLDGKDVSGISLVAHMLDRILAERGHRAAPRGLRCVLLGGGPAPRSLFDRARDAGFPVAPTYGLTEACSQVATRPPGLEKDPFDAGLCPLPGTEVRVERGGVFEDEGEGEIVIRGPTVMAGYRGAAPGASGVTGEGWLHTGDMGRLARDGSLQVLDRRSDLIVSGGENVYPAEIEAVLRDCPGVVAAGVAGVADARFGARPAAWIVCGPGVVLDAARLRAHCDARLARYKHPVRFHFVDDLPRNATGKLMRRELVESSGTGH
jgi:O-succinylbenzoic acid--CoA ligase